MILKFGKHKNKDLTQIPTEYLFWLTEEGIDPEDLKNNGKYASNNKALIQACHDVINSRSDASPKTRKLDIPTIQLQKPGKEALIRSIQALIDSLYKHAAEMQKLLDEHKADGSVVTTKSEYLPF